MVSNLLVNDNSFTLLRNSVWGIVIGVSIIACSRSARSESEVVNHSDVYIIHPVKKDTSVFQDFQGITQFTQHLQIRAQSTGIVAKSFIAVSHRIEIKKPLFIIKSREAALLNSVSGSDNILSKVADTVFAFSPGIVDQVTVQPGDFVQEGDLLATCVSQQSMRVVVSIPLEEDVTHFQNTVCSILFPDGKILKGTIGAGLPVASNNDQTNQFLVYPESVYGLSENIHVRVRVKKLDIEGGIFVPKSSVYTNEELTKYWILKVVHDSIAVKVPVMPGIDLDSLVQLKNNTVRLTDAIVLKGGYALPDSSIVNVLQPGEYGKK